MVARNTTLDGKIVSSLFPDVTKYIWPLEVQMYDEDGELNICVDVTMEYRYIAGKTNRSHTN